MKFTKFLLCLLLCCITIVTTTHSQINKNVLYTGATQFIAGFADGTNQAYLFHYHNQFYGAAPNSEAWKNKWKLDANGDAIVGVERFKGSSTWLVWTRDVHHFTRFIENRANELSGLTYVLGYTKSYKEFKKKRLQKRLQNNTRTKERLELRMEGGGFDPVYMPISFPTSNEEFAFTLESINRQKVKHGKKKAFNKKWYWYAADFAIIYTARTAGFWFAYDVMYK